MKHEHITDLCNSVDQSSASVLKTTFSVRIISPWKLNIRKMEISEMEKGFERIQHLLDLKLITVAESGEELINQNTAIAQRVIEHLPPGPG